MRHTVLIPEGENVQKKSVMSGLFIRETVTGFFTARHFADSRIRRRCFLHRMVTITGIVLRILLRYHRLPDDRQGSPAE